MNIYSNKFENCVLGTEEENIDVDATDERIQDFLDRRKAEIIDQMETLGDYEVDVEDECIAEEKSWTDFLEEFSQNEDRFLVRK